LTVALTTLVLLVLAAVAARSVRRGRGSGGLDARPAFAGGVPARARILFPFTATGLSTRALDAALRLARAEEATLMPVFLALVPRHLPLDTPLTRQSGPALSLQEAIEQRAAAFGVAVDARIECGRTYRHGLRETIARERCSRLVVAAGRAGEPGFAPEDIAWLMDNASGEVVVLRAWGGPPRVTTEPPAPDRPGPGAEGLAPTGEIAGSEGDVTVTVECV
jgi:hypothetical protein